MFKDFKTTQKIYVRNVDDRTWIINNANSFTITTANVLIKP